ncbi:MAG: AsmA family protein [Pseudooceanicola sp.]|nr:AsmA family protein [Pseudooceanicola sp.]
MRWIVRLAGALMAVLVLAVAGVMLLPGEKIAGLAAEQISKQTGRAVSIGGEVRFSLWPVLGVHTGPVRVANADWAGAAPMLAAESLSVGLSAPDLLAGAIRVQEIAADGAVLRLARDRAGRGNWEFSTPTAAEGASSGGAAGSSREVTLERLSLRNARVEWVDAGAAPVTVGGLDLTVDWPDPAGAADISVTLAGIEAKAQVGDFAAFLKGDSAPVAVNARLPGGTVAFDGRADAAGAASGNLLVKATDTARMLAVAGLRVDLPQGAGRSADLSVQANYTPDGRLSLRDMVLVLDRNRLTGAAELALDGKPRIAARLQAGALDFSTLGGAASAGSGGSGRASGSGWSDDPIDASALALFDGNIGLTADSIRTPATQLGRTEVIVTVDRARAVADFARLDAFGGQLAGQLVANNRNGLSVGGKLTASGVEMQQVLRDLGGVERFSGKADASVEFLGVGASEAAIMRSLSGKGGIGMGQGRIAGIDLDALMTSGQGSGGTTVFDSLNATFTMAEGNLVNEDLALLLKNYRADGKGRVGLGARDIDYLFTPVALRARGGQGLAVPILIKGPWANPRILPDLEGVLKAKADVKLEKLEAEAKAKAKEKLSEKLGVPVDTRAEAEEAVKDKVEDEVKKGLLKLLGRN